MGDPSFSSHPIQDFLKEVAQNNLHINNFLNTTTGQEIILEKIDSYSSYRNFELTIFPSIGKQLFIYLNAIYLDKQLTGKNTISRKNKI